MSLGISVEPVLHQVETDRSKHCPSHWHLESLGILQRLPLEILEGILLHCDALTIARSQRLSRAFHEIVKTSLALQYKIECFLADVVESPAGHSLGLQERRQAVRRWRKAWGRLHWSEKHTIPFRTRQMIDSALCVHYTVLGDAFVGEAGAFQFVRQSSELRRVQAERWEIRGLPELVKPEAWTFDVSQDVLAMLQIVDGAAEVNVCFFSCKTGKHYQNRGPYKMSLMVHNSIFRSELDDWDFNIRLFGDIVSLLVSHGPAEDEPHRELYLLNWKTREIILELYSEPSHRVALQDLGFLDRDHILCGGTGEDTSCIAVIHYRTPPQQRMSFEDFIDRNAKLVLRLPPLAPDVDFHFLHICSSPRFSYTSDSGLFRPARTEPVILVDLGLNSGGIVRLYNLIIPSHVVRSRLHDPTLESCVVPWDAWGRKSRLFELPLDRFGQVSGSQYLVASDVHIGHHQLRRHERLVLCDFAPLPVLLHSAAEEGAEIVQEPSCAVAEKGTWAQDIVTAAPYRVTVSDIPVTRQDQVILMQDGIINIAFSEHGFVANSFDFYAF